VENSIYENIAIIIPKAYYFNILKKTPCFNNENIHIITANRFDTSQSYDKIIAVGDFYGKRFDALKCRAAPDIIVLLYECEISLFKHKKQKASMFERKLNLISELIDETDESDIDGIENDDMEKDFEEEFLTLESYINTISDIDIQKLAERLAVSAGNVTMTEVSAVGRFASDEQVFFSKYYKAVIYNSVNYKKPISEVEVKYLSVDDSLVFTKRNDFTKNIVDDIYEILQFSGKLSKDVLEATEKAFWWKNVLRKYRETYELSYSELAKELENIGCILTETTIRQWLVPDSHIVCPREERTLKKIAELTNDSCLQNNIPGYFNACKIVRKQRKRILDLIGKAITDKLCGRKPPLGSELEILYDNVDNLYEILELEALTFLDKSILVPINLINKPIEEMEVFL